MSAKIQRAHLERLAYVYVRQSSVAQVLEHQESLRRQSGLARRAVELGWAPDRVHVIDEDLGQSGRAAEGRSGFQKLAQEVSLGRVGAIFALEVSRLARCSADWQQLLRLCRVSDVVLTDEQTVYDPRDGNDRLILGVKGMMSETELDWMALRMHGARVSRARRGEYRLGLPTGYIRNEVGAVAFDHDEQVRRAITLVFERFRIDGSAARVARYFAEHELKLPCRERRRGGHSEIIWVRPWPSRVRHIVQNPGYAGAYVYGRRARAETIVEGQIRTRVRIRPVEECEICLLDHHPAYIPWEEYVANRDKMRANAGQSVGKPRAPREGVGLLGGLVLCGRCGGPMAVRYPGRKERSHFYICTRRPDEVGVPRGCGRVAGVAIDRAVEELFLESVAPAELDVTVAVDREVERQAAELDRQWQLRLERTRYEADLAERRYKHVDPANRTVARTLERDWEERLAALDRLRGEYEQVRREKRLVLCDEDRAAIRALARDLPAVWSAPTTALADRKQLLRLAVEQIALRPIDVPRRGVQVRVLWKTGAETTLVVDRQRPRNARGTAPQVLALIRDAVALGMTDEVIAKHLNDQAVRPVHAERWTRNLVASLRRDSGIPCARRLSPRAQPPAAQDAGGRYSVRGLAERFGATVHQVREWRRDGILPGPTPARRGDPAWYRLDEATERRIRRALARSRKAPAPPKAAVGANPQPPEADHG